MHSIALKMVFCHLVLVLETRSKPFLEFLLEYGCVVFDGALLGGVEGGQEWRRFTFPNGALQLLDNFVFFQDLDFLANWGCLPPVFA